LQQRQESFTLSVVTVTTMKNLPYISEPQTSRLDLKNCMAS